MANTEIDSLSLNISINGLSDRDIKNLESLSESIAKLQRNLRKLELSKLQEIKIPENVKGVMGVTYNIKPFTDVIESTDFDKIFDGVEETFTQVGNEANTVLDKINTDAEKVKVNTKETNEEVKKTPKTLKQAAKQLTSMEKSLRRIKTISFVKLIREALNYFIKGLQQGIKNLAQFDKTFNESMSSLSTAKTQIFNSLALVVSPIITAITPLVETLSNSMIQIANTVSMISAAMNGMTKYTKVNVKYAEDYAKALQKSSKFSFDTFNSLQTQDSMFETAEIEESISQYQDLVEIIQDLKTTFEDIKDLAAFVSDTVGDFLKQNLGNIKEIISQSSEFTNKIFSAFETLETNNLFKTLSEEIFPTIIDSVGDLLDAIIQIVNALMPVINVIINKLVPVLLKLVNNSLKPIFALLEKIILPIIVEIVEVIAETLEPVLEIISGILDVINIIFSEYIDYIVDIINFVGDFIIPALKMINNFLGPINAVLKGIAVVIETIVDLVNSLLNSDFDGFIERLKSRALGFAKYVAKIFENIVNGVIEFINAIIANDFVKTIASWFGGDGWKGIEWRADWSSQIPSFANGGIVGEVWQMNERGNPEMLYNPNNNGDTSVINTDQLSLAFERAIYNTGILNAIEESGQLYIDGKYIAQSKSFKSELNRTNPKLSIK